jgi:hypothetical protein
MRTGSRTIAVALTLGGLALGSRVEAGLPLQKKAKELGLASVQNCLSCHVDKMPKKGADKLNDMGQWLVDQKGVRKAKEIDPAWLKEYKPSK